MAAYVGSSGWSYPEWRGSFYPADAQPPDFLRLYAERLNAVELNATFYRLPSEAQLEAWAAQTPPDFRFAVKLSRHIAHGGRLERLATFCERVRSLGDRLGPVLVELPDDRPRDDGFLHLLLDSLPPGIDVAIEPKHPSWAGAELPVRVGALDPDAPFALPAAARAPVHRRRARRARAPDRRPPAAGLLLLQPRCRRRPLARRRADRGHRGAADYAARVNQDLLDRYADVAVRVGANLQRGQTLLVTSGVERLPLARAIGEAGWRAGAGDVQFFFHDDYERYLLREARRRGAPRPGRTRAVSASSSSSSTRRPRRSTSRATRRRRTSRTPTRSGWRARSPG